MSDNMNVNFRAPRAETTRFYAACKRQGLVGAAVLRRMLHEFAAGNITFPMKKRGAKQ